MLNYELSKLVDYIGRFGKCTVRIKVNNNLCNEFPVFIKEDGSLNLNDEEIKQLLSILYGEAFLARKNYVGATTFVEDTFKDKLGSLKNCMIVFQALSIFGFCLQADVLVPDLETIPIEETVPNDATRELAKKIVKMLCGARTIRNGEISILAIYDSFDEAQKDRTTLEEESSVKSVIQYLEDESSIESIVQYLETDAIPSAINSTLSAIRTIKITNQDGANARNFIGLFFELQEASDAGTLTADVARDLKEKFCYSQFSDSNKKKMDAFISEFLENADSKGQNEHGQASK